MRIEWASHVRLAISSGIDLIDEFLFILVPFRRFQTETTPVSHARLARKDEGYSEWK